MCGLILVAKMPGWDGGGTALDAGNFLVFQQYPEVPDAVWTRTSCFEQ